MASFSSRFRILAIAAASMGCGSSLAAFDSGSTGADGPLAPTADVVIPLPPNGVLNYTSVNIPAGVNVSFQKNAANTPVTMLVQGNVKIAGTIDLSGKPGNSATQPVILGVTNKGGAGGPGGFDGGMGGGAEQNRTGGNGYGPGGGWGAPGTCEYGGPGHGGAFAENTSISCTNLPVLAYGSNSMLPVIGGSGGGGGVGGSAVVSDAGAGGGGGGGALLLVASGAVELTATGKIVSLGGVGGNCGAKGGNSGGGGSGGMVRILAVGFSGPDNIDVRGGLGGCQGSIYGLYTGGTGSNGRKSIEVVPNGGSFSPSAFPTLAITGIGGVAVPANPTGVADVTVPTSLGNPITVTVSATGVPTGTVVKLTLNNNTGGVSSVNTSALAGSLQASAATGSITIPNGSSVLMASTTYTLTLAQGEALSVYAQGERVEKVELSAVLGGEQRATLITVSGKAYDVSAAVLALLST